MEKCLAFRAWPIDVFTPSRYWKIQQKAVYLLGEGHPQSETFSYISA